MSTAFIGESLNGAAPAVDSSIRDGAPGADALEREAERLATEPIGPAAEGGRALSVGLRETGAALHACYRAVAPTVTGKDSAAPAVEWLVENFHFVDRALQEARTDLQRSVYRKLPSAAAGALAGCPRIFGLMQTFTAHTDGRFDAAALRRFVRAFQRVDHLAIGEIWAIPSALRVALLDRLRQLAGPIAAVSRSPRSDSPGRAGGRPGPTALDVSVRRIITSLREMAPFEWAGLFESVSLVDAALRRGSQWDAMDVATRDRYRHAVEDLARGSGRSELDVVQRALRCCAEPGEVGGAVRDPGHYLLSDGRPRFERELGYHPAAGRRLIRAYVSTATASYLATIGLLTAFFLALPLLHALDAGMALGWLVLLGLVAAIPASDLATALVHRAAVELLGPRRLPRLALREGVPPSLRTMVVIPALLTRESEIEELIGRLEVHYLANTDGDLRFALLSDWLDAPAETMPGDDRLLAAARAGIRRLNQRHPLAGGSAERFVLLHRRRRWNPSENVWMGWERKRGKLHELNRLLRGATDTTFLTADGRSPAVPSGVRYVITLDADTRLPRGAAARLIGTLAHPLNRPRFDPRAGRVVGGYAILQPRVTPTLPTEQAESVFQRVFSGPAGIDPYSSAVSDVYQDLFGEGSYTGKGIYEIDAFEAALAGRTPENALLSHDLFEGLFARAGLVSDIELFEEFPSSYEVSASRQHRWARGDWQLLPWILRRRAPGAIPTRLPVIARWKMVDNLRRTLSAPAAFLTLVAAWTMPNSSPAVWTQLVLVAMAIPLLIPAAIEAGAPRAGLTAGAHLRALAKSVALAVAQLCLNVVFLAHQAWSMADAIARTLCRLAVTRRKLLEWVTAARVKAGLDPSVAGAFRRMRGAVALGAAAAILVALAAPGRWPFALPFVLLWLCAPLAARWVSQPLGSGPVTPVSTSERRALRSTARRTWRFFETLVGPEDNYLPPDNLQEDPARVVAHRTSPTNIGLALLATVTARDLGWIGTEETVERLERTLASARRLERFRGHFLNWYDTRTLTPLEPSYVSTVDSGNLAGHLIVLANACREVAAAPLLGDAPMPGIEDPLRLAREALDQLGEGQPAARVRLAGAIDAVAALLAPPLDGLRTRAGQLRELRRRAEELVDAARALSGERGDEASAEVLAWAEATRAAVESHWRDVETFMPWLPLLDIGHGLPTGTGSIQALLSGRLAPDALALACAAVVADLEAVRTTRAPEGSSGAAAIDELVAGLRASSAAALGLGRRLSDLNRLCRELFGAMQFDFLVHDSRRLFSIGYRVADGALDPAGYDLLASEARLASFVAIAKGDVSGEHWFRLARPTAPVERGAALVSWSGSMFEYLMPELVMGSPPGSLLEQTARLIVRRQQAYAASRGVPWGISESAYNVRDPEATYQYSNFGVPDLGLDQALGENLVVAPYATGLAAMVDARAAARNFADLARAGARGPLGFYEALDYTRGRLGEGQEVAVVKAYMAHHQGMTLIALGNVLGGGLMRARFHAEPMVQATELLLQERPPQTAAVTRAPAAEGAAASVGRPIRTALSAT